MSYCNLPINRLALTLAFFSSATFASGNLVSLGYEVTGPVSAEVAQKVGADWAFAYGSTITLKNTSNEVLKPDFSILMPSPRRVLQSGTEQFSVSPITGDLTRITPTTKYLPLQPGQSVQIPIISEYWSIRDSDTFPRWMIERNGVVTTIANTDSEDVSVFAKPLTAAQAKRHAGDNTIDMDVNTRFAAYTTVASNAGTNRIIPSPIEQIITKEAAVSIKDGIALSSINLPWATREAMENSAKKLGILSWKDNALKVNVSINPHAIASQEAKKAGGYTLTIKGQLATVNGFDAEGALNGYNSLLSLIDIKTKSNIAEQVVNDAPRYEYRGYMIDLARNFRSKETILKTIEQMSMLKLNTLHLHLTDDEGWRIEIDGLDELTQVGSKRLGNNMGESIALSPQLGHGSEKTAADGFLRKDEYVEILKFAAARNINVIPEIDMPGHSRAAVMAMEARYHKLMKQGDAAGAARYRLFDGGDTSNVTTIQAYNNKSFVNPCLPSFDAFTDKVIDSFVSMHVSAGVPLKTWHFGGDEAKNALLGGGYANAADAQPWQGIIDKDAQDAPYAKSPACQKLIASGQLKSLDSMTEWVSKRIASKLQMKGIHAIQGWNDGFKTLNNASELAVKPVTNVWEPIFWGGAQVVSDWSQKGFGVVLSLPDFSYLDFPAEDETSESGYYWASQANPTKKIFGFAPGNLAQTAETALDRDGNGMSVTTPSHKPIVSGMSGHAWGELMRTDAQYEYMTYPRLFALAERSWFKPKWENEFQSGVTYSSSTNYVNKTALEADYDGFANAVGGKALAKLDAFGINYRMSKVGAKIIDGKLHAKAEFPMIQIQYSTDGKNWHPYNDSNKPTVSANVFVRTYNGNPTAPRYGKVSQTK